MSDCMLTCMCMRVYVRVTKGRLNASVCISVCKCICVSTHAYQWWIEIIVCMYKPSCRHNKCKCNGTHTECNTYYSN